MDQKKSIAGIRAWLEVAALLAFIFVCLAVSWKVVFNKPASGPRQGNSRAAIPARSLPEDPVSLEGTALKGSRAALVGMVQYSEFQCPFCAQFAHGALPEIEREYIVPGLVLFAFKHLPIESIHPFALKAAEGAECAARQGKFWEMHDLLFMNPKQLQEPTLHQHARALGIDDATFTACLAGETTAQIRQHMQAANALGVTGTPTFFIGRIHDGLNLRVTHRVSGAQPFSEFQVILEEALKAAKSE